MHQHSTRKESWTTSRVKHAQGLYMAETRAEDQTALHTQNLPPKSAQLYPPTGINAYKLCPRMLYTERYRTKCAAKNKGDQFGPHSKQVDSMQTSS